MLYILLGRLPGSSRYSQAVPSSRHCELPLIIAFTDDYLILAFWFPRILCVKNMQLLYWPYSWNEIIGRKSKLQAHPAYEATAFGNWDGFCQNEEADVHIACCLWRGFGRGSLVRDRSELLCLWASLVLHRSPPRGCAWCPASSHGEGPAWCGNHRSPITFMWLHLQCLPKGSYAIGLHSVSNPLWEEILQFLTHWNHNQSQDKFPFSRAASWDPSWLPTPGTWDCFYLHLCLLPACSGFVLEIFFPEASEEKSCQLSTACSSPACRVPETHLPANLSLDRNQDSENTSHVFIASMEELLNSVSLETIMPGCHAKTWSTRPPGNLLTQLAVPDELFMSTWKCWQFPSVLYFLLTQLSRTNRTGWQSYKYSMLILQFWY